MILLDKSVKRSHFLWRAHFCYLFISKNIDSVDNNDVNVWRSLMRFDEHFFQEVLPGALVKGVVVSEIMGLSVDTRSLQKGFMFAALKGSCHDGHDFLAEALRKGALGLLIDEKEIARLEALDAQALQKIVVVVVADVLQALFKLASSWRTQFTYPVLAVTGSVGKTSTKALIGHILDCNNSSYVATTGNQNSRLGLALNILRMRKTDEYGIFELGVSKRGEMAQLVTMLRPTTALITAVGHSHMEGLGDIADVAAEKRDIFKCFSEDNIGIINGDQACLASVSYRHPVIKFGSKTVNQIQARKIIYKPNGVHFVLKIYNNKYPITLKKPHMGGIFNALAATAAACLLKIPDEVIIRALQTEPVVAGRFEQKQLKSKSGGVIIDDCYNANPESMKSALLAFEHIETKDRKIAVLGDMLELGSNSPFWHRQIGRFLRKVPTLDHLILVGEHVQWTKKTVPVWLSFEVARDWQEAKQLLQARLDSKACVLVKGSLGMQLGKLVQEFSL